jgi:flavin-dependent dehydrogenase
VIPIGNAAAAIEPIGGEGMGLALRSAELAADAVRQSLDEATLDSAGLRKQFERVWKVRGTACRALAVGVSTPSFARLVIAGARSTPGLPLFAMQLIGKN